VLLIESPAAAKMFVVRNSEITKTIGVKIFLRARRSNIAEILKTSAAILLR
jgi:hypothetical protein